MIILFDSARINPAPATFGVIPDPIDWEAMAEDVANMDAVCRGFVPL